MTFKQLRTMNSPSELVCFSSYTEKDTFLLLIEQIQYILDSNQIVMTELDIRTLDIPSCHFSSGRGGFPPGEGSQCAPPPPPPSVCNAVYSENIDYILLTS